MVNDYIDAYDCYNLTWETNILHLAVNEDKKEGQLQQELILDHAVLLPSNNYHDNLEQHDKLGVLTFMKKELDKLRQKYMYEERDKSTLSQEQLGADARDNGCAFLGKSASLARFERIVCRSAFLPNRQEKGTGCHTLRAFGCFMTPVMKYQTMWAQSCSTEC